MSSNPSGLALLSALEFVQLLIVSHFREKSNHLFTTKIFGQKSAVVLNCAHNCSLIIELGFISIDECKQKKNNELVNGIESENVIIFQRAAAPTGFAKIEFTSVPHFGHIRRARGELNLKKKSGTAVR